MTDLRTSNPCFIVAENRQRPEPLDDGRAGRRPGILVVDDEQSMRDMLRIAFNQRGFAFTNAIAQPSTWS
jgi:hypothetical protein